jgi:hypothetical protein
MACYDAAMLNFPNPTDEFVAAVVDHRGVRNDTTRLARTVQLAVFPETELIDADLLEQAILGAITRFVETAIDGQL